MTFALARCKFVHKSQIGVIANDKDVEAWSRAYFHYIFKYHDLQCKTRAGMV